MTATTLFYILVNSLTVGSIILMLLGCVKKTPYIRRSINNIQLINVFIAILGFGCGIHLLFH